MNNFIVALMGGVALFAPCGKPEPMTYESPADYCYWRLFMYDHFNN